MVTQTGKEPCKPPPDPFHRQALRARRKSIWSSRMTFYCALSKTVPQNENFLIIFSFAPHQVPLTTSFAMPLEGFWILKQHARAKAKTKSHCALLQSSLLEG